MHDVTGSLCVVLGVAGSPHQTMGEGCAQATTNAYNPRPTLVGRYVVAKGNA